MTIRIISTLADQEEAVKNEDRLHRLLGAENRRLNELAKQLRVAGGWTRDHTNRHKEVLKRIRRVSDDPDDQRKVLNRARTLAARYVDQLDSRAVLVPKDLRDPAAVDSTPSPAHGQRSTASQDAAVRRSDEDPRARGTVERCLFVLHGYLLQRLPSHPALRSDGTPPGPEELLQLFAIEELQEILDELIRNDGSAQGTGR